MEKRAFVDQLQREVSIPNPPKRIVSLVPSLTEFLHYLGFENEVIGITKFCVHPETWFEHKERIGGTKTLKVDRIIELKPDLVIGNKEENAIEDISALEKHVPVWMSAIDSFEDAMEMIRQLGAVLNCEERCSALISKLQSLFGELSTIGRNKSVLYFIWKEPDFLAGADTFIGAFMEKIGFTNACEISRYPALEALSSAAADYVFLSSEPFPFSEKHKAYFQSLFPQSKIVLVDGEMFSWYGSRMLKAADYFKTQLISQL